MSNTIKIALTPLAAAISAALAPAGIAQAQDDESSVALDEIIVTATKREENLQDIPASIHAIPESVLERIGALGIADYTRFIPSVNVVSYNPGATDIVFRGVMAGSFVTIGQLPSSMYIDEMPITTSGSQPEVRLYDINRIESLDGPQGTLFGGSAQSGTLRVITNQPDTSQLEGRVEVSLRQGPDTGLSDDVSGMINLPFADNQAALRLAGFTATDAGFIDNVFGHTPNTHFGVPIPTWGSVDNAAFVEDEWNETDFYGGHVAVRWKFNDDWAATVSYMSQWMDGKGPSHFDPNVGDLQVIKFYPESRWDDWDLYALTVEGDLGWAQVLSATSFFDRNWGSETDNTVYTKYFQTWACLSQLDPAIYTGYFVDPSTGSALAWPRYCYGPSSLSDVTTVYVDNEWAHKFSQEVRLSGGTDRLDWIVGLYYERNAYDWVTPWGKPTNFDYQNSVALQYWETVWGVGFAPDATHGWHPVSKVDYEQTAVFGEFTWQLNDQWTANIGARWFDQTMDNTYHVENPNTQMEAEFVANGGPVTSSGGTDDVVPKINISYHPTDNATIYGLYSEGFRPGGTNRGRGNPILPLVYEPDKLKNTEIGIKTMWGDGRVRANLTWFDMEWEDFQMTVVDPSFVNGEVWQQVIANVGNAEVRGVQLELDIAVNEYMMFGANVSNLEAQVTNDIDLDGEPGAEITAGSRLPLAPEFKASGWLDFNWPVSFVNGEMFTRLQVSHTGNSFNQLVSSQQFNNPASPLVKTPSYTITDFRVGLVMENGWQVDLFVNNLTDERAQYTEGFLFFELPWGNTQDGYSAIQRIYTNRPLEFGLRISKHWSE